MKRQGFTFLEVVLALAIIGIISAFLLRIVSGSIGITDSVSKSIETELGITGEIELDILDGDTWDRDYYPSSDSIDLPGTGEVVLRRVEHVESETGHVYRYYVPEFSESGE